MKRLIVTADDFGVAAEVNEAVEQAHTKGVLTAASLMVGGGAVQDAVERARRLASLRVGLHVVLIEGRPVLPPDQVPDLVDATGLPLDHVNTHKHFHLHPTIAGTILKVGRRHGLKAMRVPTEPRAVLAKAEPEAVFGRAYVTGPWSELVRLRLRKAGVATADHVFGLRWSGALTPVRMEALLRHLPDGLSEIYLHPATRGGFDGAAEGYRYAEEFAALTDPGVIAAIRAADVQLGGFADFTGAPRLAA